MENLAGNPKCDSTISRELYRCGIPEIVVERTRSEVPYTIEGRLGRFRFWRAWYYWVAEGPVPLRIARLLYENPVGKDDVRVAGHCGCPSPDEYGQIWRDSEGFILWKQSEIDKMQKIIDDHPEISSYKDALTYVRAREDCENPIITIDLYHIDSELGFYLFSEMLKKEGLV